MNVCVCVCVRVRACVRVCVCYRRTTVCGLPAGRDRALHLFGSPGGSLPGAGGRPLSPSPLPLRHARRAPPPAIHLCPGILGGRSFN